MNKVGKIIAIVISLINSNEVFGQWKTYTNGADRYFHFVDKAYPTNSGDVTAFGSTDKKEFVSTQGITLKPGFSVEGLSGSSYFAAHIYKPNDDDLENRHQILMDIWQNTKNELANSDIYYLQQFTNNFLVYTAANNDYQTLNELAELYLLPFQNLSYSSLPPIGNQCAGYISGPAHVWLSDGNENILNSSQFLYVVSKAVNIFLSISPQNRLPYMDSVLIRYPPIIIRDHYLRWISGVPRFQVRDWHSSCSPGCYNLFDLIEAKRINSLGNNISISYCNSVSDVDLWIAAGVSEILSANAKDAMLVEISSNEKAILETFMTSATELFENRISYSTIKNFTGNNVSAANFDLGAWDDHPDYLYAGNTTFNVFPLAQSTTTNIGWDFSHARRFVHAFNSLYANRPITGQSFPDNLVMTALANQYAYKVFSNQDLEEPLFANYIDGSNGWYRVNYNNNSGYGIGPHDSSLAAIEGGWGFWDEWNPDIRKISNALWQMIQSNHPDILSHRNLHYNSGWSNYIRTPGIDFSFSNSLPLLQFLPTIIYSNNQNSGGRINTIETTIGLKEELSKEVVKFQLFPNPTNGILWISPPKGIDKYGITVKNGLGSRITEVQGEGEFQLDLSDLPKGLYFIEVNSENIISIYKIINL